MHLIRTADRHKLTADNRPAGCTAHSAGRFRLRADGSSHFDRHHHDFDEFWFVSTGHATVALGDTTTDVQPGDIIYTPAGTEHDIVAVTGPENLQVFWLSWTLPEGARGEHLHSSPADAAGHLVPARSSS